MDQITQKLANASHLRMKQQAERYAKARNFTAKVAKVRMTRNLLRQAQTLNSVKIDRKHAAATSARHSQLKSI